MEITQLGWQRQLLGSCLLTQCQNTTPLAPSEYVIDYERVSGAKKFSQVSIDDHERILLVIYSWSNLPKYNL